MPDERVVLEDGAVDARVETGGFEGTLPLFVARSPADTLAADGVLLRPGHDAALVRVHGRAREVPLWKRRADGSLVRVRVRSIAERQR